MTTIALQNELIKKISAIKDKQKLFSINEYVEMECETFHSNGAIQLTPEMIKLIEIGQEQCKNGQVTPHEQVMAEMDIWLRERA
jgi:predicted transcriptional regulator